MKQRKPRDAKTEKLIEFIETHSSLPSLTIAKMFYAKNTIDWKDVEAVRFCVRYYRGSVGKTYRNVALFDKRPLDFNPWGIGDETVDLKPIALPLRNGVFGIISDLHIPNHRVQVIDRLYKWFKSAEIGTLIINGDLLDNTPFTRHEGKRPTSTQVREWFELTELFLEYTRDQFPDADIYWLEGNHDFWYRRWMLQHAWQLDEDPYFSLQERLHLGEYRIQFIDQKYFVKLGKLNVCHGHQLSGKFGAGVMPARMVFNKTKSSTMISHVHVADSYTDNNIDGDIYTCFTTGCTCTLTPDYQPFGGKACHGGAIVTVEENRHFKVDNRRILNGEFL